MMLQQALSGDDGGVELKCIGRLDQLHVRLREPRLCAGRCG